MIHIKISCKENVFRAVSAGHADYDPGNDVVCAAVSALMYQLKGSVENLLTGGKKIYRTEPGHYEVKYKAPNKDEGYRASIIYNCAIIGLLQVEATYPSFVRMTSPYDDNQSLLDK